MRTTRLRNEIANLLSEREANTRQILDHLNRRFRYGTTMHQVSNILAKDRRFEKVSHDFVPNRTTGHYTLVVWGLTGN